MNWEISGKHKNGKKGTLKVVGGPNSDDDVRAAIAASHPGFSVEKATPLDGTLQPITRTEAKELTEATTAAPTETPKRRDHK